MRAHGTLERARVLAGRSRVWRDRLSAIERTEAGGGRTRLQTAQAVDIAGWLPNDVLTKLDRCLMAHGIEGRVPLLDPAVVDASLDLPDSFKVRPRRGKWPLRRWPGCACCRSRPEKIDRKSAPDMICRPHTSSVALKTTSWVS